jgi:hypothetical protein
MGHPVFFNYRYCFKPDSRFTPHTNIAIGWLMADNGEGIYSTVTAGFMSGNFSFSSGLSFLPVYGKYGKYYYEDYYNDIDYYSTNKEWYYLFGFLVKIGFAF